MSVSTRLPQSFPRLPQRKWVGRLRPGRIAVASASTYASDLLNQAPKHQIGFLLSFGTPAILKGGQIGWELFFNVAFASYPGCQRADCHFRHQKTSSSHPIRCLSYGVSIKCDTKLLCGRVDVRQMPGNAFSLYERHEIAYVEQPTPPIPGTGSRS